MSRANPNTFDLVGRRTVLQDGIAVPVTTSYDAAGRTRTDVSPAGTTTLTYDYESRVTSVVGLTVTVPNYGLPGLGRGQRIPD